MSKKRKICILLVEDDVLDRMAVERAFKSEKLPYILEYAETAVAARKRLSQGDIDLVLLDQNLPDGTGLEVQKQLKGIPSIFLTGASDASTVVEAMKAGAYDFLVKDTTRDYLQLLPITIEKALNRKRDEEELERYRSHLEENVQLRTVELHKANERLGTEVAERIGIHEKLRRSEEHFRSVTQNASDAIITIDSLGQVILFNQATQTIFGITKEKFLGQQLSNIMPERYREAHYQALERLRSGSPARLIGRTVELHGWRQSGTEFPMELSLSTWQAQGEIYYTAIIRDISERKQAEDALQESEELHRITLGNINDPLFITDDKGKFTFISPNITHILGYTMEELENRGNLSAFIGKDLFTLDDLKSKGEISNIESVIVHKDGEEVDYLISVRRVSIQGGTILYSCRDITERKQIEKERQLNVRYLENMDRVNQSLMDAQDLDHMMTDVLDTILSVFGSDRAWLLSPGNPNAPSFRVPMERTRKEFPGAFEMNIDIPMIPEAADVITRSLESSEPVTYDPQSLWPVPVPLAEQFNIRSQIIMAIYPKRGQPWIFGMHQCSYERIWTLHEVRLFKEIGQRISDSLNSLLFLRVLQDSEKKYRDLIELAQEGIWVIDKDSYTKFVNPSMAKMLGYSHEEMMGKHFFSFMDEQEIEIAKINLEYRQQGVKKQHDFEFLRKDGNRILTTLETAPILDEAGNYNGLIAGVIDITERVRAEEALRQLNQAMEQSPVSVLITDTEGIIQYVNPKFSQVTGYSAAEAIGQTPRILNSGEHSPEFYTKLWDTVISGREWQGAFRNKKKNGELYWAHSSIAGVKEQSGQITHFVSVSEDITQRKRREEEHVRQERLAAVGQLAAGIAHDFNNVMAVITLYSELLQKSNNLSENERKKVQTIYQQAHHAADLTQQILDFSRRSVRESHPMDLKLLLNEMLKFVKRTLPESIQVRFSFSPGNYMVIADPTQLQQMTTNLIVNARDAMPRGGNLHIELEQITVEPGQLSALSELKAGDWVRLTISDTGMGIPPDVLPHIFEPFFTTKETGEGTGLGLAQVYGIVGQHEGHIYVETQVGEGTKFAIYLPVLVEETAVHPILPTAIPQGHGETILLVEDNLTLLEATRFTLESFNYQVITAVNGQEALDLYRNQPDQISLILADVVMPKMDGFELVKALQQRSLPPKVLLMSGFPRDIKMSPEMKQLVSGWLQKPIDLRQLAEAVQEALTLPASL